MRKEDLVTMRRIFISAKKASAHSDDERRYIVEEYAGQHSLCIRPSLLTLINQGYGSIGPRIDKGGVMIGYRIDAMNPVNEEAPTALQWLTLGHELGHIVLIEHDIVEKDPDDYEFIERWCDQFAVVLFGLSHIDVAEYLLKPMPDSEIYDGA